MENQIVYLTFKTHFVHIQLWGKKRQQMLHWIQIVLQIRVQIQVRTLYKKYKNKILVF